MKTGLNNLFEKIFQLKDEYINFLVDICNIESPSDNKEGIDAVSRYICEKAGVFGWKIEIQSQQVSGNCVCITMNPEADGESVCFSGHMDTVHPVGLFGYPAVKMDDEKIYGPGVLDCKGGIAAAFLAMRALYECGFDKRPVRLILQSDEEVSSVFSDKATVAFMAEKAAGCVAFLNCEPHYTGAATLERKGICKYEFSITGKSAHSGVCYNGVNAILEAARKIIELEKHKDPDGITVNCGTISGGTKDNTVPEKCVFTVDSRFKTFSQMQEIDRIMKEIANKSFVEGTQCLLTLKSSRISMEKNDRNLRLLERINEIYKDNDLMTLNNSSSNGGSDAADMSARGIPCIDSVGMTGGNIHSRDEFAYISSLAEAAKRLAAVAYCI
ncbi:MAG: M20/M25/M40 family metallo-hydrolase [Clostridia bacterium]|nr:M20/M25/M40 family metallo-hydrolase [Clostridia bacterium]